MYLSTPLLTILPILLPILPVQSQPVSAPLSDPRFNTWSAPSSTDVRSPCPGLNTLANHNFLPHSGKNLTLPQIVAGLGAGLNLTPDFAFLLGALGLLASPRPDRGSFDLNDLAQHNFPIEHDASLSRGDAYFGNPSSFHAGIWRQTVSFFDGGRGLTGLLPAALAMDNRTRDSEERNPTFVYGGREYILRYGETSLYLQTMGSDDSSGVTRVDWVRSLFEKEKLPVSLGWKPRVEPVSLESVGRMVFELSRVSPDQSEENSRILADSYKNVLQLAVGGSEILGNLTKGLSKEYGF